MKHKRSYNRPAFRQLRGYAFDPITSMDLDTTDINQITYQVPWEDDLDLGPDGEYIKVIDRDPMSNAVYEPVNLNDPDILAMDGLTPSETNPQFHQQMVYAVIMTTIHNFEKALGRKVIWSPAPHVDRKTKKFSFKYVKQLMVYPHAVRDQNAYYSPERKALLFGYYNATPVNDSIMPGSVVYSCLSHDIIAHETTHALIDSMYPLYMEITHPDIAGFHEGFSDIVALLQHFTYPEIVRNQIRLVKGRLDMENLLIKLAVEFGQSTGEHKSLRMAIGEFVNGKWKVKPSALSDYDTNIECHDRGALLVAAVFDAFNAIYKRRTADLLRIASGGSGEMPDGDLHPDLVNRLAIEATQTASRVLNMCVRALDYCPPVDLHYGDYLRALITADKELVNNDEYHCRIAFINAFRKRGIFPAGIPNMSVDTVCYALDERLTGVELLDDSNVLRNFKNEVAYITDRQKIYEATEKFIGGEDDDEGKPKFYIDLMKWFKGLDPMMLADLTGLVFSKDFINLGIRPSDSVPDFPATWIQSLRLSNRTGPDGVALNLLILTMVQSTNVLPIEKKDEEGYNFEPRKSRSNNTFRFRGGCTLVFDLDQLTLKHAIVKPIFEKVSSRSGKGAKFQINLARAAMQYDCQKGQLGEMIGLAPDADTTEFFAALHNTQKFVL